MTRAEEAALIERVLGGETDAVEPLVVENQSRVYHLALKMLSDPEDAYDVSQEAFLKAFTSLKSFKGESSFSSWLYRITANLCLDQLRSRKKQKAASLVYLDDEEAEQELQLPDLRYEPEAETERRELCRAIDGALEKLPAQSRSILLLREASGLSYSEIGETLGLEEGTVKSRLFRARAKLAKILRDEGTFFEK